MIGFKLDSNNPADKLSQEYIKKWGSRKDLTFDYFLRLFKSSDQFNLEDYLLCKFRNNCVELFKFTARIYKIEGEGTHGRRNCQCSDHRMSRTILSKPDKYYLFNGKYHELEDKPRIIFYQKGVGDFYRSSLATYSGCKPKGSDCFTRLWDIKKYILTLLDLLVYVEYDNCVKFFDVTDTCYYFNEDLMLTKIEIDGKEVKFIPSQAFLTHVYNEILDNPKKYYLVKTKKEYKYVLLQKHEKMIIFTY